MEVILKEDVNKLGQRGDVVKVADGYGRNFLLPKRLALPIFASDALSSVAYATQEILLVLTLGGTAFFYLAPWIAAAVIVLMLAVVASYRQLVRAYPTGGGDYEVATKNIGRSAGVVMKGLAFETGLR